MDFQSRINQFRQGLKDQQDSYNSLAQSSAQYGRSIIPDKVAQHLTYMEQVGGMVTGASAGLHGAVEVGKKINKFRLSKQAKNNPTGKQTQQGDQASKSSKQGEQQLNEREAQSQEQDTKGNDTADQTTAKGKPEAFDEGESGGIKAPKLEMDDEEGDDLLTGLRQQGVDAIKSGGVERVEQGEGTVSEDPFANVDFSARGTSSGGSNISRTSTSNTSSQPNRTQADDDRQLGEEDPESSGVGGGAGSSDARISSSNVESTLADNTESSGSVMDTLSEGASRFTGAVGDAVGVVKTGLKDAVSSVVGEVGGEAIASTVPILGELVGLGLLIRSVIEHHKHEENAPPPKLTAPNPEATEQSGGFSDAMLKGSVQAPSIV